MSDRVIWQSKIPGWLYQVKRLNGSEKISYRAVEDEECSHPLDDEKFHALRRAQSYPTSQNAIDQCEQWRQERQNGK
jgi:hypothetical protein